MKKSPAVEYEYNIADPRPLAAVGRVVVVIYIYQFSSTVATETPVTHIAIPSASTSI